jgi:hypothetical protein
MYQHEEIFALTDTDCSYLKFMKCFINLNPVPYSIINADKMPLFELNLVTFSETENGL